MFARSLVRASRASQTARRNFSDAHGFPDLDKVTNVSDIRPVKALIGFVHLSFLILFYYSKSRFLFATLAYQQYCMIPLEYQPRMDPEVCLPGKESNRVEKEKKRRRRENRQKRRKRGENERRRERWDDKYLFSSAPIPPPCRPRWSLSASLRSSCKCGVCCRFLLKPANLEITINDVCEKKKTQIEKSLQPHNHTRKRKKKTHKTWQHYLNAKSKSSSA